VARVGRTFPGALIHTRLVLAKSTSLCLLKRHQCLELAIGIEQVRGVVAGSVVPVPGGPVRAKAGFHTSTVERVDVLLRARVEERCSSFVGGVPATTLTCAKLAASSRSYNFGIASGARIVS
jgi:hypothetical protein